jgi:hypothetical protein
MLLTKTFAVFVMPALQFQECPSGLRSVGLRNAGLDCQFVSVPYQYRKTRRADYEDPPLQSSVMYS